MAGEVLLPAGVAIRTGFYASLGPDVQTREVQTTIQGQSISSNFGTPQSAGLQFGIAVYGGLAAPVDRPREIQVDPGTAAT